ncbi:MAG: YbfB/YjiJ family MFS transporter [Desulfuromonadia bacterium]
MPRRHHPLPSWYPWLVLAAGTAGVYAALGLARFGYSVVLPAMQGALGLDNTEAGVLASANLVGYLLMALLGGALASRFGARFVVSGGLALISFGMVMTGFSRGFFDAAVWRFITGVGSGAANVAIMGMWASWFPRERRGLAAGIAVTGSAFAMITTGPLVPFIISLKGGDGWRYSWEIFALLSFLAAIFAWVVIRGEESVVNLSSPYGGETHPKSPNDGGSWHSVLTSRSAWHLGVVYVAFGFSYIIYMTFFVKHLITGGYDRSGAGRLFTLIGWSCLMFSFFFGWLSDRIGRKWTMASVSLVHAAAFTLFGLGSTPLSFILSAVLYGATAFSIPAVMAAACGDIFGRRLAPAALGFITLLFGIGQAAAPGIAGAIADRSGSFSPAFLLAAGVALLGAVGAATLRDG